MFLKFYRDKVQARLVELLALAASKDVPNSPLHVDESVLCGIPGKVVDSVTLHNILKIPPQQHVYYGPGKMWFHQVFKRSKRYFFRWQRSKIP